jgi:hypothetical protein
MRHPKRRIIASLFLVALLTSFSLSIHADGTGIQLNVTLSGALPVTITNVLLEMDGMAAKQLTFDVTNAGDLPISALQFSLDSPNYRIVCLADGTKGLEDSGIMSVSLCWQDCATSKGSPRMLKKGETIHLLYLCTDTCSTPATIANQFPPMLRLVAACHPDGVNDVPRDSGSCGQMNERK